jgi:hypothetical protein
LRARAVQSSAGRVLDVESYEEVLQERSDTGQSGMGSFIRFNSMHAAPEKLEDGIRFVRDQVVPLLKQQTGFRAVMMGVQPRQWPRVRDQCLGKRGSRQASDAREGDQRSQAGELLGGVFR